MWILTMNWVDEVITIKKHISMNFAVFFESEPFLDGWPWTVTPPNSSKISLLQNVCLHNSVHRRPARHLSMQVAKLFLQTRWSLTIGNLLLIDNESQMTECDLSFLPPYIFQVVFFASLQTLHITWVVRIAVKFQKKSSNWWPFLIAHTSVVFLHEQWKWLWLFWVVKEIIILFVIKKIREEIRQQRSKVPSVSNQTYMYTYMYIYLWMYPLTTIVESENFCQNPQVLDCESILGVTSEAFSAGWPISQHRLGRKVNGCECRRESCECCCWLLYGSVFDTHWY